MAISDDRGQTWYASQPLLGFGNIQPAVLRRDDGTLVAYMRENGRRKRVRIAESKDDGEIVGQCRRQRPAQSRVGPRRRPARRWPLAARLQRHDRPAATAWPCRFPPTKAAPGKHTRHLEEHPQGSYHYPAIIQGKDGTLHVVYSYFVAEGKSMKHAAFNEAWVKAGDGR